MKLFEPLEHGALRLPNRIAVTAMVTRLSGSDGYVNDAIVERYQRFAEGGSGLIVVEASSVHGGKSGPLLKASSDDFVPGLRRLTDAVHAAGDSKVFLQIIHFMKVARSGWRQRLSDLDAAQIQELPELFAAAACRARDAGFDGVELHMAHAYTMSSFLSRKNPLRYPYGGSLENRMRMPSLVVQAVREAVGEDWPVGIRFDAEECIKDGYSLPDAAAFAVRFAELGVAYVSLSAGGKFEDAIHRPGYPLYPYTGYSGDRCMPGAQYPDAFNMYLARGVRAALRDAGHATPVIGAGKIGSPELAESVLQEEQCDVIGMARALLADPWWPAKLRAGKSDEIVRCIYCNVCKNLDENFKTVRCYLWPVGAQHGPRPGEFERAELRFGEGQCVDARAEKGRVVLRWPEPEYAGSRDRGATPGPGATHESGDAYAPAVSGYDIYRSHDGCDFELLVSSGRRSRRDDEVLGGRHYAYYVVPYDAAGRRGLASPIAEVDVPAFGADESRGQEGEQRATT